MPKTEKEQAQETFMTVEQAVQCFILTSRSLVRELLAEVTDLLIQLHNADAKGDDPEEEDADDAEDKPSGAAILKPWSPIREKPAELRPGQRHVKRKVKCLVESFGREVREAVEEMLLSNDYTYQAISDRLRNDWGVIISKSAIARYASRFYDRVQEGY